MHYRYLSYIYLALFTAYLHLDIVYQLHSRFNSFFRHLYNRLTFHFKTILSLPILSLYGVHYALHVIKLHSEKGSVSRDFSNLLEFTSRRSLVEPLSNGGLSRLPPSGTPPPQPLSASPDPRACPSCTHLLPYSHSDSPTRSRTP
jgi:hypothetical protein